MTVLMVLNVQLGLMVRSFVVTCFFFFFFSFPHLLSFGLIWIADRWLIFLASSPIQQVQWTKHALEKLSECLPKFAFVHDFDNAHLAISQVVLSDPRSVYRKKKMSDTAFGFHFGAFFNMFKKKQKTKKKRSPSTPRVCRAISNQLFD
jgi:hypothetical protein